MAGNYNLVLVYHRSFCCSLFPINLHHHLHQLHLRVAGPVLATQWSQNHSSLCYQASIREEEQFSNFRCYTPEDCLFVGPATSGSLDESQRRRPLWQTYQGGASMSGSSYNHWQTKETCRGCGAPTASSWTILPSQWPPVGVPGALLTKGEPETVDKEHAKGALFVTHHLGSVFQFGIQQSQSQIASDCQSQFRSRKLFPQKPQ